MVVLSRLSLIGGAVALFNLRKVRFEFGCGGFLCGLHAPDGMVIEAN